MKEPDRPDGDQKMKQKHHFPAEYGRAMAKIRRFLNKLSVKIITSIIIMVTLLTVLIGVFSYQVFTQTMLKETTSIVKQIADSLVSDAEVWDAALYLEVGSDRMEELWRLDSAGGGSKSDNKTDRDITEDYITFGAFTNIAMRFNTVIHAQNIDQIGMIIPDPASNYSKAAIVISQNNELKENEVDYGVVGKTLNIDRAEDRDGLRKIWEGSEAEAVTIDYLDNGEAMVSMMKILKKDGEKNAVLVVNRSIKNMVNTSGRYVIGIMIMGLSMVLIATLIIGLYLRSRVVKPVGAITREAERFAGENKKSEQELAETVGGITELRVLAESIDKMEEDTVANMEEIARMSRESERLETELSFAADLQRNVLPDGELLSNRGEFVVAAFMEPAREVGGDFYDFFLIDDTHLVLLIADVSDKGVGAAFFMAVSKTLIKARAGMGGSASKIIAYAEEKLSEENKAGMFVTVWLGIVDLATGEVNACNAGHNFPAILKKDIEGGYRIEKTAHGSPICFLPGMEHVEYNFRLAPGERLFLYTDGVTEAKSPDGDRFGNDRLVEALNEDPAIGDESLIRCVKEAVDRFAGEEPQYDDMTMVSFTYLGKEKA